MTASGGKAMTASGPEFVPEWDVLRDEDGAAVTITDQQVHAIWRAFSIVEAVRKGEGYRSMWDNPQADIYKSRLLGRMLCDGLPPTKTKPPLSFGGPWWGGLPGGDPFDPDRPAFTLEAAFRVRCEVTGCRWNQAHDTQEAAVADAQEHLRNWHNGHLAVAGAPRPRVSTAKRSPPHLVSPSSVQHDPQPRQAEAEVRLDTATNQIAATRALLDQALTELEDLHVLAYDRAAAAEEIHVAGGARDYALDTHGDSRVRDSYRYFSDSVTQTCGDLAESAHALLRHLTEYTKGTRTGPVTTSAMEYALLLEAKARRAERGEYQPVLRLSQPGHLNAAVVAVRQTQRAERLTARLFKALAKASDRSEVELKVSFGVCPVCCEQPGTLLAHVETEHASWLDDHPDTFAA